MHIVERGAGGGKDDAIVEEYFRLFLSVSFQCKNVDAEVKSQIIERRSTTYICEIVL